MKRMYLLSPAFAALIILLLATACKKEDPATIPDVSTTPANNITATSAMGGGSIISDGGATITANGVCWGTSSNPSVSDSKTADAVGTSQYISSITGLSEGTTYHIRAYATNAIGTAYGADLTFNTLGEAPTSLTQPATNVTTTSATLNGTVDPNHLSTTVTFEYGTTTSYGNSATATQSPVTGSSMVNVNVDISGLEPGTTYHFRVKTVNSLGTVYGEDMSFTTNGQAPTAITQSPTNISSTGATLNGTVNANHLSTTVIFEYGTSSSYGSELTASENPLTGNESTSVSGNLTGLSQGTTYHYRVKATNALGTVYGSDMSFATLDIPTVVTADINSPLYESATGGGNITSDGGATVTTRGVCWNTTGSPTIADNKTSDGSGTGSFTSTLTGLAQNTTYYVRAYATNSIGTAYGNEVSFKTLVPPTTEGLVAYYPFNGNANDESGNEYHGTVNGTVLVQDRFDNPNSAYYFDGVDDYINITSSSLVDNETTITVSCWLKREHEDEGGLPIHTGNQGRFGIHVISQDSLKVNVTTDSDFDGLAPTEFDTPIKYFNQTDWNHIILRYDGDNLRLYINNELKSEVFAEGKIWTPQSSYLAFGVYMLFGNPNHGYYKGILDDVRLYRSALSEEDLTNLYHEGGWY